MTTIAYYGLPTDEHPHEVRTVRVTEYSYQGEQGRTHEWNVSLPPWMPDIQILTTVSKRSHVTIEHPDGNVKQYDPSPKLRRSYRFPDGTRVSRTLYHKERMPA